jgi:tungstate transport system ATP-binding protein
MNITVEGLYKEYNGTKVLDIDKLEFSEGSIYAVLGLNGSGKTTLLECIAGINKPDGGIIQYDNDQNIENIKGKISIMLQHPYLFNMSVRDNITIGLKFKKVPEEIITERVNKYLKYFNINDLLNKNAKGLSGGESAKTALLRTAVTECDVTMLDEPTASMDIESTLGAERLIKDIAGPKNTIIIVTHDIYQAVRLADYMVFMDKGRIIEAGKKEKVLKNPENSLVRFLMNGV